MLVFRSSNMEQCLRLFLLLQKTSLHFLVLLILELVFFLITFSNFKTIHLIFWVLDSVIPWEINFSVGYEGKQAWLLTFFLVFNIFLQPDYIAIGFPVFRSDQIIGNIIHKFIMMRWCIAPHPNFTRLSVHHNYCKDFLSYLVNISVKFSNLAVNGVWG